MSKVILSRNKCIGCAICVDMATHVFEMNKNDGKAQIIGVPLKDMQQTSNGVLSQFEKIEIIKKCPVGAILIK